MSLSHLNNCDCVEQRKNSRLSFYIAALAFALFFTGGMLFGALNGLHKTYSQSQATLVIIAGILGILAVAFVFVLRICFGICICLPIAVSWWIFVVLHLCGEMFLFYYTTKFWDQLLHVFSGSLVFFTVFGLVRTYCKSKHIDLGIAMSIAFAFAASLAIACLWEIIEFSIDSLFGTNMQKFIPETDNLFNGGNSFEELKGTQEEIAEFYRQPQGYKYALTDSMTDCVDCLAGTVVVIIPAVILVKKNPERMTHTVYINDKRRTDNENDSQHQ